MIRPIGTMVLLTSFACLVASMPAPQSRIGPQPAGGSLLHTGWTVTPAGKQVPLGTLPMSMALSPDGKHLLILNGGYEPPSISVVDVKDGRETARVPVEDAWLGITFSLKGDRVYVSGGSRPVVFEFRFEGGELKPARRFAVIQEPGPADHVGDVALSPDGRFLYVANVFRNSLTVVNALTGFVTGEVATGRRPYRVVFAPDGKTFYVSHWADASVGQYNTADGSRLATVNTGPHPTDMAYLAGKNEPPEGELQFVARLFVACANTNSVVVLGISEGNQVRMVDRINVSFDQFAPAGATPSGLALSPDRQRLFVACSGNNAVAVVDVGEYESELLGFVPTGWYPTAARAATDGRIFVANGRGAGGSPAGSLSIVPAPGEEELAELSRRALANSPYIRRSLGRAQGWSPVPIQHVIYIVKGNRTYDQVLGDLKEGNGDPSLTQFGEEVTPNHHKLAREFVLLDNFYVHARGAAEGYHWSTAAIANDFVQKMGPAHAAGRRKIQDFEGAEPLAFPPAGYLWTNVLSAGLTLRSYGFQVENDKQLTGVARVRDPALDHHTDKNYVGPDPDYSDQKRADQFLREFADFVRNGNLPRVMIVRLDNDRTAGSEAGKRTPRSMVADNDYALGRIVEAVSQSPVWSRTAVFVLESDAQDGSDHVDPHRSLAFVASAYSKRGIVDSTHYTTASMLRTMGLILGLRPMTLFDAGATPMAGCFATSPDPRPYTAEKPRVSLDDRNPPAPPGA